MAKINQGNLGIHPDQKTKMKTPRLTIILATVTISAAIYFSIPRYEIEIGTHGHKYVFDRRSGELHWHGRFGYLRLSREGYYLDGRSNPPPPPPPPTPSPTPYINPFADLMPENPPGTGDPIDLATPTPDQP